MKIDKFDQLSEKLLQKLNEDYVLFEGSEESADGMMDPKEALQHTLSAKKNKEATEASKSYQTLKKFPDSPNRDVNIKLHKKEVIDRETAANNLRKAKLFESQDILTEDELSDYDMGILAEEFENDLQESNQQMIDNMKILKDQEQKKLKKDKEEFKEDNADLKQAAAEQTAELKDEKAEQAEKLREKQAQEEQQAAEEAQKQQEQQDKKIKQHEDKIEKFNKVTDAARQDNVPGGTKPMTNEEYAENMRMFKEQREKQMQLEEDFAQRSRKRKLEKARKKLNKAQEKEGKIAIKRAEMTKKYGIDDDNAQDYEELFIKRRDRRKAFKIKKKWAKLSHKQDELHRFKTIPADDKMQEAERDYKGLEESLDLLAESCEDIIKEVDALFEEYPFDAEFLAEAKKGIRHPESEYTYVVESDDPMVKRMAKLINEQLALDEPDYALIKTLKMKIEEYKK